MLLTETAGEKEAECWPAASHATIQPLCRVDLEKIFQRQRRKEREMTAKYEKMVKGRVSRQVTQREN